MGTAYKPSAMQGIIIPDQASFWEEQSGQLDNAFNKIADAPFVGKVAGDPVASDPANPPEMRLRAAGEQTSSELITCNRRGLPVLDECGVLRRPTKDGNTDDRGRDLPNIPTRFEPLLPAGPCTSPHIVTLDDDSVLACWWRSGTGVQVQSRSPTGVIGSVVTAHSASGAVDLHPCLAVLPSGAVRLYYWRPDGADYQVGTRVSRDRGTTWSDAQDALTSAVAGATLTSVERLRAVYWRGMMLLTAHVVEATAYAGAGYRDRIATWSSSDGGGRLYHVSTQDGATEETSGGYQDLAVVDGQCVIARIRWSTAAGSAIVAVSRISSARMSIDLAGEESDTSSVVAGTYLALRTGGGAADYLLADSDLACWVDDDGALYLAVRRCDTAAAGPPPGMQACFLLRSSKRGDAGSWFATGDSDVLAGRGQAWYWDEAGNSYPTRFAMTAQRGRTIFACDAMRASTGILATSIFLGYLGGWQSRTMPSASQSLSPYQRISWMRPQFAIDSPDAQGWLLATSGGAETHVVTNFREQISAPGVGEYVRYYRTGALFSTANGAAIEAALHPTAGTAYVRIYAYDALPTRAATEVRITTTTVELWDLGAGAQIGVTWNRTASGRIRVRLAQEGAGAECRIYEGSSTDEDRKWEPVAVTAALANAGAWVADSLEIEFGAQSAGSLDEWSAFWGAYCGQHFVGQTTSQRFPGCVTPSGCFAGSGIRLSSITGPAEVGDQWTSTRTWQYPPQAILPRHTPSPRSGCRVPIDELEATAAWVQLAFKIGDTETFPFNTQYGALFDRMLMGGAEFLVYYGAAWHAFGTQGRYGFVADRRGKTLRVNTGGPTRAPVVRRNELADAFAELVSGGGPTSDYQLRVTRNSPGAIDTSAGASFPMTAAVAQSLVGAPAQPTVRVYPTRVLMLEDLATLQEDIMAWAIRFPVRPGAGPWASPGPPPSGYYELGSALVGPVILLGQAYDWGRRQRTESGTTLTTARDGSRIAEIERPVRHSISFGYSGGVPTLAHQSKQAPDFLTAYTGGPAAGFRWDVPIDLADIMLETSGASVPIGYLPSIRQDDSGGSDHHGRGALIGRCVSDSIDVDSVAGDEVLSETLRLQAWDFDEES